MKSITSILLVASLSIFTTSCGSGPGGNKGIRSSTDARVIESKSRRALADLYSKNPDARRLGSRAQGILIFPEMTKGGFIVGGAWGDGALYQRGRSTAYFRSVSASYGLQAGVQEYGYALFLMDYDAINSLVSSDGWELGAAPGLTVVDKGITGSLSTTTVDKGTVAIFFNQKGLMGGIGVQGTKISRLAITP